MPDTDILGRGFAFPLSIGAHGGIAAQRLEEKVRESILVILGTQRGERLMRPDFGCDLGTLVFAPNAPATANLAAYYVEEALSRWEPRVELQGVTVENDTGAGRLLIHVRYRLRPTLEPGSLVYPFYLEPA
jgi:phage baseplate assembly protein W